MPQQCSAQHAHCAQDRVRDCLLEAGLVIEEEDPAGQCFLVNREEDGISRMLVVWEEDLLVMEQAVMPFGGDAVCSMRLLQMNRGLLRGAFCLTPDGATVVFRHVLPLAALDSQELAACLGALSLALAEGAAEFLAWADRAVQQGKG